MDIPFVAAIISMRPETQSFQTFGAIKIADKGNAETKPLCLCVTGFVSLTRHDNKETN